MDDEYAAHVAAAERATAKIAEWQRKQAAAVLAAYADGNGASPAVIGKAIGRSDQAVRDMLRRLGAVVRSKPGRPKVTSDLP